MWTFLHQILLFCSTFHYLMFHTIFTRRTTTYDFEESHVRHLEDKRRQRNSKIGLFFHRRTPPWSEIRRVDGSVHTILDVRQNDGNLNLRTNFATKYNTKQQTRGQLGLYVLNKRANFIQKYSRVSEKFRFSYWGVLFWRILYNYINKYKWDDMW